MQQQLAVKQAVTASEKQRDLLATELQQLRETSAANGYVRRGIEGGLPTLTALGRWHSGAYLLETVPTVLLLLARYADDPEEAVIRAVNDTKDNDSIAAIVGAAMGALYGSKAWPARWVKGLTGRLDGEDDGAMQAVITQAKARFGA